METEGTKESRGEDVARKQKRIPDYIRPFYEMIDDEEDDIEMNGDKSSAAASGNAAIAATDGNGSEMKTRSDNNNNENEKKSGNNSEMESEDEEEDDDDDDMSVPTDSDEDDYATMDPLERKRRREKRESYDRKRRKQMKKIERYNTWKRYVPSLYDHVGSHVLEWPTLFVQWLPRIVLSDVHDLHTLAPTAFAKKKKQQQSKSDDKQKQQNTDNANDSSDANEQDYITYPLLLGSYAAAEEKNSIMIAQVSLPKNRKDEEEYLKKLYDNAFSAALASVASSSTTSSGNSPPKSASLTKRQSSIRNAKEQQRNLVKSIQEKIEQSTPDVKLLRDFTCHRYNFQVKARIPGTGEVKKARYMPQNPLIIASTSMSGDVIVHDLAFRGKVQRENNKPKASKTDIPEDQQQLQQHEEVLVSFEPCTRLRAHAKDGYGLRWSPFKKGVLLTGADDHSTLLWDVDTSNAIVTAHMSCKNGHTAPVNDVAWHTTDENIFASVSDDRQLLLWDYRTLSQGSEGPCGRVSNVHGDADVNCVGFQNILKQGSDLSSSTSPLIATGAKDKTVKLWDIRNLNQPVFTLKNGHHGGIVQLGWHPSNPNVLASSASDATFCLWDVSLTSSNSDSNKSLSSSTNTISIENEPAWLKFTHGGHTSSVFDFDWLNDLDAIDEDNAWTIASCAMDNIIQIWSIAKCHR